MERSSVDVRERQKTGGVGKKGGGGGGGGGGGNGGNSHREADENVVGSYQHNVDIPTPCFFREFRGFERRMAPEIRSEGGERGENCDRCGGEKEEEEEDEIEMELPEGTDGPAGFRIRRKIKTRPNGCEGKFYPAPALHSQS